MPESSNPPLISVLIATYNRSESLCRAIQSVLDQPGDYFELVIVNDASPDNTHEAVQPYLVDPRVRYSRNEVNLGMCENYLNIFGQASGDYIFVLTDDDWLVDGGLERVAQTIRKYPQVGYILSDLPTVDARTGEIVSMDRAYSTDKLMEPSLENMAQLVGFAWVLSRQVIRRDLIDWETWQKFKNNIFFPIIYSGRALLKAPSYYMAEQIVMHTWFNEVFWHKFGKDQLDIGFNLSVDHHQALRAVLHDYELTPEVRTLLEGWERKTLTLYLHSEQSGFYDLIRVFGLGPALVKLQNGFNLTPRGYLEIGSFFFQTPARRTWIWAKSLGRQYAPNQFKKLKTLKNRLGGSSKAKLG